MHRRRRIVSSSLFARKRRCGVFSCYIWGIHELQLICISDEWILFYSSSTTYVEGNNTVAPQAKSRNINSISTSCHLPHDSHAKVLFLKEIKLLPACCEWAQDPSYQIAERIIAQRRTPEAENCKVFSTSLCVELYLWHGSYYSRAEKKCSNPRKTKKWCS